MKSRSDENEAAPECPSTAVLELCLAEQLSGAERNCLEAHVEFCSSCQERLEQLVATLVSAASATGHQFEAELSEDFLRRLKQLPVPRANAARDVRVKERPTVPAVVDHFEGQ